MECKLAALLKNLEAIGAVNDAVETDRSRRMLNLEPDTARLIALIARSSGATRILEIGTSNGYSTLWLAWAVVSVGGRVTTIERDAQKHAMARAHLAQAGLQDSVEFLLGDATTVVAELSGPFDLVFFDADRISAPEQLRSLLPKLTPRVSLLADNVLSHPEEIAAYLDAITQLADFEHIVVPVGKGLSFANRSGPSGPPTSFHR